MLFVTIHHQVLTNTSEPGAAAMFGDFLYFNYISFQWRAPQIRNKW